MVSTSSAGGLAGCSAIVIAVLEQMEASDYCCCNVQDLRKINADSIFNHTCGVSRKEKRKGYTVQTQKQFRQKHGMRNVPDILACSGELLTLCLQSSSPEASAIVVLGIMQ